MRLKPGAPFGALPEALVAAVVLAVAACGGSDDAPGSGGSDVPEAMAAEPMDSLPPRTEAERPADWERFRETVHWARARGLDTLPMGDAVARIGEHFVGTPYRPHTLEIPGPERLVVNLEALDCVTFVENALALARFVKSTPAGLVDRDEPAARARYRDILEGIRYRGGRIDGYPSRLHYFSDWIADNASRGQVRDVTAELGGIRDPEAIDFMSTHPDAYRQLADDPALVDAIREVETRLSQGARRYIPEDRITLAESGIRTGDIIAATSTVMGLDVAHTGIALRRGGRVYLMHAPLVGDSVRISERTLDERVQAIDGQDGIMVARPLPPSGG